jgi:hypothetical protein
LKCTQWICMGIHFCHSCIFKLTFLKRNKASSTVISSESDIWWYDPTRLSIEALNGCWWYLTENFSLRIAMNLEAFHWKYLKNWTRCRMSDCNCKLTGSGMELLISEIYSQ